MGAPDAGRASEAGWTLPKLRVDVNGDWFDDDVQVTHAGILANLRGNLRHDAAGYFIQTRVRIPVEVEDMPWVVVRIERRGDALHVLLNDGTDEQVDPSTLRIGRDNVPYCAVKEGRFEARLSRAAAFQLLALTEPEGGDAVRVGGRTYALRRSA